MGKAKILRNIDGGLDEMLRIAYIVGGWVKKIQKSAYVIYGRSLTHIQYTHCKYLKCRIRSDPLRSFVHCSLVSFLASDQCRQFMNVITTSDIM